MTDHRDRIIREAARKLRLVSTDFDGTIYSEFEPEPIVQEIELLLSSLQKAGTWWVINTGRDLSSLMESLARSGIKARPDFVVVVEREIHELKDSRYLPWEDWNQDCERAHRKLFARVRKDLPELVEWVSSRYKATIYEDPFSPFCLVGANNSDTDAIQEYLEEYCLRVPELTVVRNDVYIRFSHHHYNKGTALTAIARRKGIQPSEVVAAGDHLNDLPMLRREHAHWLIAPGNAVEQVKAQVKDQRGYISSQVCGRGIARGLESFFEAVTVQGKISGNVRPGS